MRGCREVRSTALLLIASFAVACGGPVAVDLTDADAGRTVDLQVGQTLVVTLEGRGTAGFVWDVTSTPGPALEQVGGRETLPLPNDAPPGRSAREQFRFRGARSGQTTLTLALRQAFGAREVAKTFEVTVRVQ